MRVSTSDITGKRKGSGSNDIFEKCRNFTRPSDLQSAGLYMYFEVLETAKDVVQAKCVWGAAKY